MELDLGHRIGWAYQHGTNINLMHPKQLKTTTQTIGKTMNRL